MTEVRHAGPDDVELWREVRLRSLLDSPDAFGSTHDRERAFTREEWLDRIAAPAVLALDDGVPVGLGAGFEDVPGWCHVVAMWTAPEHRGTGVGTRVLAEVVGWARAHGLRVHLDVAVANDGARRLYEREGFVATGELRPLREGSELRVERMVLRPLLVPPVSRG